MDTIINKFDVLQKHTIATIIAFLIGVPTRFFDADSEHFDHSLIARLELNQAARLVRAAAGHRAQCIKNEGAIKERLKTGTLGIFSMGDILDLSFVTTLEHAGFLVSKFHGDELFIELNRFLSNRINNTRELFPSWFCFEYFRDFITMPDGLKASGVRTEIAKYYDHKGQYPYSTYVHFARELPQESVMLRGNILLNDNKITSVLYYLNGDYLKDKSKVREISDGHEERFSEFMAASQNAVLMIDSENVNPEYLSAWLNSLDQERRQHIVRAVLVDDQNSSNGWETFLEDCPIPCEVQVMDRINSSKSRVDMSLAVWATVLHYTEQIDSFILASSDSDYWSLIQHAPKTARFFVLLEHRKISADFRQLLDEHHIGTCFIDDIYTGGAEFAERTMLKGLTDALNAHPINLESLLDEVMRASYLQVSDTYKQEFLKRHNKIGIVRDGNILHISLTA